MKKRKVRRFLVTVEEVEPDPLGLEHQEPAPMQKRKATDWWSTAQKKREQAIAARRERARRKAEEQKKDA